MPLRRALNTFSRHNDEDTVMSDETTSAPVFSSPLAPSRSVNGSSSLGKRRRSREPSSVKPAVETSSTTADYSPASPLASPTDTTPLKRPKLSLDPIDNTFTSMPELSSPSSLFPEPSTSTASSSHDPEPASPAPTEIAYDLSHMEHSPEDQMDSLLAAGIKVRDFALEPMPNALKAPEVFDPVPHLIALDWHLRNPHNNYGLLSGKSLFRLVKMGWVELADLRGKMHTRDDAALAFYNDLPDERRYPFVVPRDQEIPTPSQRVRLRRQAGLPTRWDDHADRKFFGYDPTGFSDDEGEGETPPHPEPEPEPEFHYPLTPPMPAETASASAPGVVEAEEVAVEAAVEEPRPKRRKVKGTTKARGRAKAKPLRRECSRPEV